MILVLGYGNPLRSDDAVGWHIADAVEHRLKGKPVQVLTYFQLAPELVAPMRHAQLVIFLDARVGATPGEVMCERVQAVHGAGAFTHNTTPGSLLAAAGDLYGACPSAFLYSITGENFGYGEMLSPSVHAAVPVVLDAIETQIEQWQHCSAQTFMRAHGASMSEIEQD